MHAIVVWTGVYGLLGAAIFAASWMRFPNFLGGCVDYIERPYYKLTAYYVPKVDEALRIIRITNYPKDELERRQWRPRFARVLDALARAGARVVAFDIPFNNESDFDAPLVAAIQRAGATRVVLGYEPRPGEARPISAAFTPVIDSIAIGSVLVGERTAAGADAAALPRYVLLSHGRAGAALSVEPTFPLQVKLAWESGRLGRPIRVLPDLEARCLRLRDGANDFDTIPSRLTIEREDAEDILHARFLLQRIWTGDLQAISQPFDVVESWLDTPADAGHAPILNASGSRNLRDTYAGRLVLVGADVDEDRFDVAPNDVVFGYAVHASVISALLQREYPHEPGILPQIGLLWLLGFTAGVSRVAFPGGDRTLDVTFLGRKLNVPVTLIVLILVFVGLAIWLFKSWLLMLDPVYDIAALILGYYLAGALMRRWPLFSRKKAAR
jgi:CHASE2 domain-containing sensor protein